MADSTINGLSALANADVAANDLLAVWDTTAATTKKVTTDLLLNKPRLATVASSAAPTPNADTTDFYYITALAEAATFGIPTGTPVEGQRLTIRIKDNGTARALGWNAIYRVMGVIAPTTTVISKLLFVGLIYNAIDSKWDMVSVNQEV